MLAFFFVLLLLLMLLFIYLNPFIVFVNVSLPVFFLCMVYEYIIFLPFLYTSITLLQLSYLFYKFFAEVLH